MIAIELNNIKTKGLEIKKVKNSFDLTSGSSEYENSPVDGGIEILPEIKISGVKDGIFYITQICQSHKLEIKSNSKNLVYESKEELRDTSSASSCHYKYYRIKKRLNYE